MRGKRCTERIDACARLEEHVNVCGRQMHPIQQCSRSPDKPVVSVRDCITAAIKNRGHDSFDLS